MESQQDIQKYKDQNIQLKYNLGNSFLWNRKVENNSGLSFIITCLRSVLRTWWPDYIRALIIFYRTNLPPPSYADSEVKNRNEMDTYT